MRSRWLEELPEHLLVGTSSYSSNDWAGVFYPDGLPAAERLSYYATQFPTVEVDATFYRCPSPTMVSNWHRRTPDTFRFALKVPREITHELALVDTDAATAEFIDRAALLGDKLSALLLQFPYHPKGEDPDEYAHGRQFTQRLATWLDRWGGHAPWAVEIRNGGWLRPQLIELLRQHRVPLALTAYYTFPPLPRLQRSDLDLLTGPFAYVRFIGNRHRLERKIATLIQETEKTRQFDQLVEDKADELRSWIEALLAVVTRVPTLAYFNNHYAGFGPGSARLFSRLWQEIHGEGAPG